MRFLLTPFAGLGACTAVAVLFVASLYFIPKEVRRLPRNDPTHIGWRMVMSSVAATAGLTLLWSTSIAGPGPSFFDWVGVPDRHVARGVIMAAAHVAVLFLGPILQQVLDPLAPGLISGRGSVWAVGRDLVVAPFFEEYVFRAMMIPLLVGSGWSVSTAMILSPMLFGVAHFHHFIELRRQGVSAIDAAIQCLVQFAYTFAFGMYAANVFVTTGHLLAAVAVHMICNTFGVPDLSWANRSLPDWKKMILGAAFVAGLVGFTMSFEFFLNAGAFESVYVPGGSATRVY